MREIELLETRRQILDWRDKWLLKIPVILAKDISPLLSVLNIRIDEISFNETFKTGNYVKDRLEPEYRRWVERESLEIMRLADNDLKSIHTNTLNYNHSLGEPISTDTSRSNAMEISLATGSAGAALLGVPAVATLSAKSAGWGLGLLGVTVISWPVALGGAAVLGTMAIFGGSKLAKYKSNAIRQLKGSVEQTIKLAVLDSSSEKFSVQTTLQNHIRFAASTYLEALQRV